jgi:hypothetical protein
MVFTRKKTGSVMTSKYQKRIFSTRELRKKGKILNMVFPLIYISSTI